MVPANAFPLKGKSIQADGVYTEKELPSEKRKDFNQLYEKELL